MNGNYQGLNGLDFSHGFRRLLGEQWPQISPQPGKFIEPNSQGQWQAGT
jgi:hypothetical protein